MIKNKYFYALLFLVFCFISISLYLEINKTSDFDSNFDKKKAVFVSNEFIFNRNIQYKSGVYSTLLTNNNGDALVVFRLKGELQKLNYSNNKEFDESGGFTGYSLPNGYCMNSSGFIPECVSICLQTNVINKKEFSNILIHRLHSSKTKITLNEELNQNIFICANDENDKLYLEFFTYKKNDFSYLFLIYPKNQFNNTNSNKLLSCELIKNDIEKMK